MLIIISGSATGGTFATAAKCTVAVVGTAVAVAAAVVVGTAAKCTAAAISWSRGCSSCSVTGRCVPSAGSRPGAGPRSSF